MRADRLPPISCERRRLTPARPGRSSPTTTMVIVALILGGWLIAAAPPATDATTDPTLLDDSTAFSNLVVERREGGRVHDVIAFDGGMWVAHGTVVGRMVESETERLVLDPVIAFDDALPQHLAVVGDALVVAADVPERDAVRAHSRVTLWQPEDVVGGIPSGVLELGFVVRFVGTHLERLVAVGVSVGEDPFDVEGRLAIVDASDPLALRVAAEIPIEAPEDAAIEGDHLHVAVLRDEGGEVPSAHLLSFDLSGNVPSPMRDQLLFDAAYEVRVAAEPGRLLAWWLPWPMHEPSLALLDVSGAGGGAADVLMQGILPFDGVASLALRDGVAWVVTWDGLLVGFDPMRAFQFEDLNFYASCEAIGAPANGIWWHGDVPMWNCGGLHAAAIGGDPFGPRPRTTRAHVGAVWDIATAGARVCALDDFNEPICGSVLYDTPRRLAPIDPRIFGSGAGNVLAMSGSRTIAALGWSSPSTLAVYVPDSAANDAAVGRVGELPSVRDVAATGNTGYLLVDASNDRGVFTIDIEDPLAPAIAGFASLAGAALEPRVEAAGARVVVHEQRRVTVLDASEPLRPRVAGRLSVDGTILDVALGGLTAYVAMADFPSPSGRDAYAMVAIDIIEADAPRKTWHLLLPARPQAIAADGNHVYVADASSLRAFDVGGGAPVDVESAPLPGDATELTAADGWVSVALGDGGLWVMRLGGPRRVGAFLPVGYAGAAR